MTEEESLDDERDIELSSIQAIFPELQISLGEPRLGILELEVAPAKGVAVLFDPLPPAHAPEIAARTGPEGDIAPLSSAVLTARADDPHTLEYLPPVLVEISLPQAYPDLQAPSFKLSTTPDWLPQDVSHRLKAEGHSIWEEYGHSQVVFAYIDSIQQQAERAFDCCALRLPHAMKLEMLDYNRKRKRQKFEQGTFSCGVCLEPKKGSDCYRLSVCGHVFCTGCLQDFYNNAITEGDVGSVKCLDPSCGKTTGAGNALKKPRGLHPRELLDIPLERSQVQRFVDIQLKKRLESDKTAIFCPRKFCQAPARSAKYAKYNSADLESYPESDDEDTHIQGSADGDVEATPPRHASFEDRLSICSKCNYAFCNVCHKSWHGDLLACRPPASSLKDLSPEELASYEYIRLNTSPCPTCNSPSQKTHGCNHMICSCCNTHYCYLCSAWLDPGNPYRHFNTLGTGCYNRLWELEGGDEGADGEERQANAPFGGPRAAEQAFDFAAMLQGDALVEEHARAQRQLQPPPQAPPPAVQPRRPRAVHAVIARAQPQERRVVDPGLQRFLAMAADDEEDGWDSDEMEPLDGGEALHV